MKLKIHHFTTDYTGQEPRNAWQVYDASTPVTPVLYSLDAAIAACNDVKRQIHPAAWKQTFTVEWRDGRDVCLVPLLDGNNDWMETLVDVL